MEGSACALEGRDHQLTCGRTSDLAEHDRVPACIVPPCNPKKSRTYAIGGVRVFASRGQFGANDVRTACCPDTHPPEIVPRSPVVTTSLEAIPTNRGVPITRSLEE